MPSFYDCLFLFAFLVNVGAFWIVWLVSPKGLLLPSRLHPIALWLCRSVFVLTSLMAYVDPTFTVVFTTVILLNTALTATQIPVARGLGEEGYLKLAVEIASKEKLWKGLFFRVLPALFYALLALFLFFFFETPDTWGFWIAAGIALQAFLFPVTRIRAFLWLRKLGRQRSTGVGA